MNFETLDLVKELDQRRNFAINITSRRNTGKSVLVKDLCFQIKDWFQQVYIVSMTASFQKDLYNFTDPENTIETFDEEKIKLIWDSQELEITKQKNAKTKEEDMPRILFIFDDIISDPKVRKSAILKKLYVMGRHIKISLILLTQTFTGIPPLMRTNTDVSIAFHLNSYDDRDAFSRAYLSTGTNKEGRLIFDTITKTKFQCIIVLNFLISQNPQDYIRTYISNTDIPKFKMGKTDISKKTIIRVPTKIQKELEYEFPRVEKNIKV